MKCTVPVDLRAAAAQRQLRLARGATWKIADILSLLVERNSEVKLEDPS